MTTVHVGVVMGSNSDWDTMQHAAQILQEFGVSFETRVVSAHRMPDDMFAYAESAQARGLRAIIAGAGGAAHLPGMLAAKTIVPVLGVPVASKHLQGVDSLHSIVQMPKGIPVARRGAGSQVTSVSCRANRSRAQHARATAFMKTALKPVLPGATLGVLGGGQLARMWAHEAQRMGYQTVVLDPDANSPAGWISHHHLQKDYLDAQALAQLAQQCQAVTTEFENVPADALERLSPKASPAAQAVAVAQDRAREKAHFVACGVPVAPHAVIQTPEQLAQVSSDLLPGILKTARMGYDGKGQVRVRTREELIQAWDALKRTACVLEKMLPLAAECSVIVARGRDASGSSRGARFGLRGRVVRGVFYSSRRTQRRTGGQRNCAASAQQRPLQPRRLRCFAI